MFIINLKQHKQRTQDGIEEQKIKDRPRPLIKGKISDCIIPLSIRSRKSSNVEPDFHPTMCSPISDHDGILASLKSVAKEKLIFRVYQKTKNEN